MMMDEPRKHASAAQLTSRAGVAASVSQLLATAVPELQKAILKRIHIFRKGAAQIGKRGRLMESGSLRNERGGHRIEKGAPRLAPPAPL